MTLKEPATFDEQVALLVNKNIIVLDFPLEWETELISQYLKASTE